MQQYESISRKLLRKRFEKRCIPQYGHGNKHKPYKYYWGKGYGTDIVVTLINYLFTDLELRRIYLHTLAWNYRAQASFIKSGFTEVRPVRRGGQDFVLMEVLRDGWDPDKLLDQKQD